jgi:hypothetical protein
MNRGLQHQVLSSGRAQQICHMLRHHHHRKEDAELSRQLSINLCEIFNHQFIEISFDILTTYGSSRVFWESIGAFQQQFYRNQLR